MSGSKPRTEPNSDPGLAPEPGSRVDPVPTAATAPVRERKTGGGVLKRLKSRRNPTAVAADRRLVTEEELRALGRDITPDEVLGLRAVTRGK